jgi:curved DNA-binding protein CbpA
MSTPERRNLYRLLQVQPEAPVEVIKASYRALMSTLRVHPDLGGSTEQAAQLNDAYAVLSDPQRRASYDLSLKGRSRQTLPKAAAAPGVAPEPAQWQQAHCCPLCFQPLGRLASKAPRCGSCGSPLTPAPSGDCGDAELLGRRRGDRYARTQDALLYRPGMAPMTVRVKNLSLTGVALLSAEPLEPGTSLRVVATGFDAVAQVVARRAQGSAHSIHARLLTLQVLRAPTGTFVSEKV